MLGSRDGPERQASPEHFVIEAPPAAWREMIENIRVHDGSDLEHTLNYLTVPDDPRRLPSVGPPTLPTADAVPAGP